MIVEVRADTGGDELLAALGLPAPRATVILNGTTADCDPGLAGVLGELAAAVTRERLTVVTGGTDAGIFALFGAAVGDEPTAPLVGVAPRDRAGVPLEPHHTHYVLVDGEAWGDETPALLALADALGRLAPSVAVICGGGPVTRAEVAGHQRAGRPIVAVTGSGGVADDLHEYGVGPTDLVEAVLGALGV